jgi:lysozyme
MLDMAYNIGLNGLLEFKEFLVSMCVRDYVQAGENIMDSKYANDVPNRAARNVKILTEGYQL